MMLVCCNSEWTMTLSDYSDISQVLIAAINLFLAGYVIIYQIKKDQQDSNHTAQLNEQNIKLQWFKELIVQPNHKKIDAFYINLHSIKEQIDSNDLSINRKEDINNFIKAELTVIRKSFVDILHSIDKELGDKVLKNLDNLVDSTTDAIFNDELKLKNASVYEKEIGSKIEYSKSDLISTLFHYKGSSSNKAS